MITMLFMLSWYYFGFDDHYEERRLNEIPKMPKNLFTNSLLTITLILDFLGIFLFNYIMYK